MPLIELTGMGRAGVDLFFVLSGFIILHATVGRGLTWTAFAQARFRRIYLPYWPAGLVMAVIIFGSASTDSTILRNLIASVTLLPVGEPMLNVAWTLQHEIMFYACVAIGLYTRWWRAGLALWIAAILLSWLSGFAAPIGLQLIDTEFLMGIAAWAAWRSGRSLIMLATSALLTALAIALVWGGPLIDIARAGPMATAALFAAALPWLVRAEQQGHVPVPRLLSYLGDASYAIYLVHALPLLLLIGLLSGSGWLMILSVIGLAGLLAGILYHRLVEQPMLAWARGRPRR